jgi:hypothetical protein
MADFIVSKIDQKLARFHAHKAKTPSELSEIAKSDKIAQLRDIKQEQDTAEVDNIWSDF